MIRYDSNNLIFNHIQGSYIPAINPLSLYAGLGKRNPYDFGIGKRQAYDGDGKREPPAFGIGKQGQFEYESGKGEKKEQDCKTGLMR